MRDPGVWLTAQPVTLLSPQQSHQHPSLPGSPICAEGSVLPRLTGLAERRHRPCRALVSPGIQCFRLGFSFLSGVVESGVVSRSGDFIL